MKKQILVLTLAVVFCCVLAFSACNVNEQQLSLYVPDGAPALAVASILQSEKIGNHAVTADILPGDSLLAKCTSGEADVAIVPLNMAAKVCSAPNSNYQIFAITSQGLLYVVGNQQIEQPSQLVGKQLYSIGQSNTPEFVFKKILSAQNLPFVNMADKDSALDSDKVNFKFEADGSAIIPLLLSGKANFALLGEPAVSNLLAKAQQQGKDMYRLFDVQTLWQQATQSANKGYPLSCMIVKKSLLQSSSFAKSLFSALQQNKQFLSSNLTNLSKLLTENGSLLTVEYTQEIVDRCNIVAIKAKDVKQDVDTYLANFGAMSSLLPLDDGVYYSFN